MSSNSKILLSAGTALFLLTAAGLAQTNLGTPPTQNSQPGTTGVMPASPPSTDWAPPADDTLPASLNEVTRSPIAAGGAAVIGLDVRGTDNQKIGRIANAIVSRDGRVETLVVSVGGVLGVGAKDVMVAWDDLQIIPSRNAAVTTMSQDELKKAPEYKAAAPGEPASGARSPLPGLPPARTP